MYRTRPALAEVCALRMLLITGCFLYCETNHTRTDIAVQNQTVSRRNSAQLVLACAIARQAACCELCSSKWSRIFHVVQVPVPRFQRERSITFRKCCWLQLRAGRSLRPLVYIRWLETTVLERANRSVITQPVTCLGRPSLAVSHPVQCIGDVNAHRREDITSAGAT